MTQELKELIAIPKDEASSEEDELLVETLKNSEFIMPIEIIDDKNNEFQPVRLANPENEEFIALFSDEDELVKGNVEFTVLNITAKNLAEMIRDDGDEYAGVAINPFSKYSLAIPLNEFLDLF